MRRLTSSLAVLSVGCLVAASAEAQSTTEMWSAVGAEYEASDRVELGVEGNLRFGQGPQVIAAMPELGVDLEAADWLDFGVGYRLEYERDDGVMVGGHRANADGQLGMELGDLELGYRARYQYQVGGFSADGDSRHTLRQRGGLDWEGFDDWTPYFEYEFYLRFGDADGVYAHKQRLTVGSDYDFGKQEVGAFYRLDLPFDGDPLVHILGLEFGVELN